MSKDVDRRTKGAGISDSFSSISFLGGMSKLIIFALGVMTNVGVSAVTMLAVVFFWLVEHAQLQRYALSFLPAERRAGAREAWDDIELRAADRQ